MSRLLLIAGREYQSYVRTVGFWISLVLPPLIILAAAAIPQQMERSAPPPVLAVVDLTGAGLGKAVEQAVPPGAGDDRPIARLVAPPAQLRAAADARSAGEAARALIARGALDEAAVIHGGGDQPVVDLWTRNGEDQPVSAMIAGAIARSLREARLASAGLSPEVLRQAEAPLPVIEDYAPRAAGGRVSLRDRLPGILGFGFAILLWSAVTSGAGMLLNSVVEERANRILEVLASSADTVDILGGKILGAACLTATVLAVWLGAAAAIIAATQPALGGDLVQVLIGRGLIVYFLFFFVSGYLMYAALFASVGAFCDTPREAQTLLGPMMLLLVVPMLCLNEALKRPDSPLLHALAWLPPFTPFLMPAMAGGSPSLSEAAGPGLLLAVTVAVALWLATRAFRAGIVATAKPSLMGLFRRR